MKETKIKKEERLYALSVYKARLLLTQDKLKRLEIIVESLKKPAKKEWSL